MKLTEKDYFIENNALNTANGGRFLCTPHIFTLPSTDFGAVSFTEKASLDAVTVLSFDASLVGEQDAYDEAFLATLRDKLKECEGKNVAFALDIRCDALIAQNTEAAVELCYHVARRIKDCTCVCGLVLPQNARIELLCALIDSLKKKHPEYVYFSYDASTVSELRTNYPTRIALIQK